MLQSPVDSSFIESNALISKFSVALVLLLVITLVSVGGTYYHRLSEPYVRDVLALKGDSTRGHAIYEINCAGCHGVEADGIVGPSLHNVTKHRSKLGLIEQVTSGKTPPMPKFQPSTQEMADLLSYLQQL